MCCNEWVAAKKQAVRWYLPPSAFRRIQAWILTKRGCGFFGSADGCCVEFRLASCGQDSQLKIWIVSQREGAGRPTPLPQLPHLSAPSLDCRAGETEREGECADCFNLETSLQNRRILLVCGVNQLQTDSLIMDHFKTFCWNTAAAAEVCVSVRVSVWERVGRKSVACIHDDIYILYKQQQRRNICVCSHVRTPATDCIFRYVCEHTMLLGSNMCCYGNSHFLGGFDVSHVVTQVRGDFFFLYLRGTPDNVCPHFIML